VPVPAEPVNQPLASEIMKGGGKRGKQKLIESWGYSYNVKSQHNSVMDWQCTIQPMVRLFVWLFEPVPRE